MTGKVKSIENTQKSQESSSPSRAFVRQTNVGKSPGGFDASSIPQMAGNLAVQQLFRSGHIQAKLAISQPGDPDEEEADRVADQVMRMAEPRPFGSASSAIQRKCAACEVGGATCPKCEEEEKIQRKENSGHAPHVNPQVHSQIAALRGGGQPLPSASRAFFEPRFGRDFSGVRVHSDSAATESARSIQARAFTTGQDVAFGAGEYAPEKHEGRKLLAHELTHVVQQTGGARMRSPISRSGDQHENEADRLTNKAARGTAGSEILAITVPDIQRLWNPFKSKTEREKIDQALKEFQNPEYVYDIKDFNRATEDEKISLVVTLLNYASGKPRAWTALRGLWGSFGWRLPAVVESSGLIWESSVDEYPALVELEEVKKAQADFKTDIMDVAKDHLAKNRAYVRQEQIRLDVSPFSNDFKTNTPGEQTKIFENIKKVAVEVNRLKQNQKKMLEIPVYTDLRTSPILVAPEPVKFNPARRPPVGTDLDKKWDDLFEVWNETSGEIAKNASRYPWIFSLIRDEKGEAQLASIAQAKPEELGGKIKASLDALVAKINDVDAKLTKEVNWFDLVPIREQLLAGHAPPSKRQWGIGKKLDTFNHWAATQAVKDRETAEWWKEFFLQTAIEAALITVTLATGGTAPLWLGLVGAAVAVGIPAAQSAAASSEADNLTQISSGSVLPGTELVAQSQIDEKRAIAVNKKIEAIINAIMVSGDFVGFGKRMLARPTNPDVANKVVGYHLTEGASVSAAQSVVAKSEGKETVSIFFNKQSKEYMVVKGEGAELRKGLAKEWELVPELNDLVAAQGKVERAAAQAMGEISDNLDNMRPSSLKDYVNEIPMGGNTYWRRNADDMWCYFASPPKFCFKWVTLKSPQGMKWSAIAEGEAFAKRVGASSDPIIVKNLSPEAVIALRNKYGADVIVEELNKRGTIATFDALSEATKGFGGKFQAHHLVENKVLKKLELDTQKAPSVILTSSEHLPHSQKLADLIDPKILHDMSKKEILAAYVEAYAGHPDWIQVIKVYFR